MAGELRVPVDGLSLGPLTLPEDTGRYVVRVHRKSKGDRLQVFDPQQELLGEAVLVQDRLPAIELCVEHCAAAPSRDMALHLYQGLGKADKPEQAVRDATAFGAAAITLVQTERSVARAQGDERRERLRRVALAVARQCERVSLPSIIGPLPLSDIKMSSHQSGLRLVCAWHAQAEPLLSCLLQLGPTQRCEIFVGPEGGLSELELDHLMVRGFRPVSLGPYVLRTENACSAVLATARAVWASREAGV